MKYEEIGLVPAAGKGLRLSLPYPKELYPVIRDNRYKPVAQFVLDNMQAAKVHHVVVIVNETKHQLMGHFGDGHRFGLQLSYVFQEPPAPTNGSIGSSGLADALDCGYHLYRGKRVFFGMPDSIMEPEDVFAGIRAQSDEDDDLVLGLFPTTRPEKFGMVEMDADNKVLRVIDKPKSTTLTMMWGCIVWGPRFSEHLHHCVKELHMGDFAEIMNTGLAKGFKMRGVSFNTGTYRDLGTYEEIMDLERAERQQ
ncbi:MAG: sugar phosphate nucleotidyltransferase [Acidobacteriota bacterium]